MKRTDIFFLGLLVLLSFLGSPSKVYGYYNHMPASVVIGQSNFTNHSLRTTQDGMNIVDSVIVVQDKLIVADQYNSRVLIWNTLPTINGTPADVVIGQNSFTSDTENFGGIGPRSLFRPSALASDGQKLLVSDRNNHRVLVYNTVPTSNFAAADVVIGQANFTSNSANQGGAASAQTVNSPDGMFVFGQKLFISDTSNHRVLIFNSIPTANNASADLVLGQPNFSTVTENTGGVSAISFSYPDGVTSDGNKLIVAEEGNHRIMIWNTIPTTNRAAADVVIGQNNFTSNSANQGGSVAANGLDTPAGDLSIENNRLYVPDTLNHRVLIWNSLPTTNGAYADIVIGQPDMHTNTADNGGVSATSVSEVSSPYPYKNKLYVLDPANGRLLIYSNTVDTPGLSISNTPESKSEGRLQMTGKATVNSPYLIHSVEFAVNGGGFRSALADDGGFNAVSENFTINFLPTENQPKDDQGNLIAGYTLQVKAKNTNADQIDHLFYFSPFVLNSPNDSETVSSSYPSFDFSVNKQRLALRDNLDHYAVQVRDRSSGGGWSTIIDNIPVDFASHKADLENLQHSRWESLSVTDGSYETQSFLATYSDQSSRVVVKSKVAALSGSYEWKVVAVDKAGHSQETGSRSLVVVGSAGSVAPGFPLAILSISGLGNPLISSYNLAGIKASYRTVSLAPTFYGIAWSGATVTATLTEQNCASNCQKTYTTTANAASRWGVNVPKGDFKNGKTYAANFSVLWGELFTQLPTFSLVVGSK